MKKGQITVKANFAKRTFTIWKDNGKGMKTKYRTVKFSKPEFEELRYNTPQDWQAFLQKENAYYIAH